MTDTRDAGSRPTIDPSRTGASSSAVFWVTSMVEGLGVSQIFALVPSYLREMGVPEDERLAFVGHLHAR